MATTATKRSKTDGSELNPRKKQHRQIEARRRQRIDNAMSRLRSLCSLGKRTEKSEVLERAGNILAQQQSKLDTVRLERAVLESTSWFPNTTPTPTASLLVNPQGSSKNVGTEQTLLPASLTQSGTAVSCLSSCTRCRNPSKPQPSRNVDATSELMQFASLQYPLLDTFQLPSSIGIMYVSSSGTVLDVNAAMLAMMHVQRDQCVGYRLLSLCAMPDGYLARKQREEILQPQRHTVRTIERFETYDGTVFWCRKTLTRKAVVASSTHGSTLKFGLMTIEPVPEPAAGACLLEDPSDFCDGPEHPLSGDNIRAEAKRLIQSHLQAVPRS
eukprot:TRINITY_DN10077_c0_g2_i1.p1 TRINITY_DN10077_c0_g2~~TRINITY_DN10077_c0_g2_i1.p1  ORF type:complete len:328 (+),score=42.58 TRINITY_DN10077_c0_g2_i1:115-1098(+)